MNAKPFLLTSLFVLSAAAFAEDAAAPVSDAAESALGFRAGGDLRLRQEAFDNVPIKTAEPAVTRGGNNNYFRIRTRLSAGLDFEDWLSLDARLCNEFRVRNVGQKSYEWPDELLLDQLKLTLRGLFDGRVDLTLGRQDASLGSGRLFGSRRRRRWTSSAFTARAKAISSWATSTAT